MMLKQALPYTHKLPQPIPETFAKIKHRFELASKTRGFFHLYQALDLSNKRMLDIGCSYGEFLIYAKSGSLGITTHQFEIDAAASIGLRVMLTNVNDRDFVEVIKKEDPFDVFYTVNIFEHVDSPHIFLRELYVIADDQTTLVLGVPVFPKLNWLMKLKKFSGSLADEHINFFTKETLVETTKRAGWHIEECRPFIFKNRFLDHLASWIAPQQYIIAKRIPNFSYPPRKITEIGDRKNTYFVGE